jgi:hypothetical protein
VLNSESEVHRPSFDKRAVPHGPIAVRLDRTTFNCLIHCATGCFAAVLVNLDELQARGKKPARDWLVLVCIRARKPLVKEHSELLIRRSPSPIIQGVVTYSTRITQPL